MTGNGWWFLLWVVPVLALCVPETTEGRLTVLCAYFAFLAVFGWEVVARRNEKLRGYRSWRDHALDLVNQVQAGRARLAELRAHLEKPPVKEK